MAQRSGGAAISKKQEAGKDNNTNKQLANTPKHGNTPKHSNTPKHGNMTFGS